LKNEIFETTAAYRASCGQKIVRFAPAEPGSAAFDPLDCIRPPPHDTACALNIATTLVEGEGEVRGDAAHWQVGARDLIAAVILAYPGGGLGGALRALSNPLQSADQLFDEMALPPPITMI
jgi:type IV secretory pathway TraG/TraD family ATPase VirD4